MHISHVLVLSVLHYSIKSCLGFTGSPILYQQQLSSRVFANPVGFHFQELGRQRRKADHYTNRRLGTTDLQLQLNYVEPVFRPPAEAESFILQVTNGCSWNKCTFCEMYTSPQKRFRVKPLEDIEADLALVGRLGVRVRRVFLADGDAMSLPVNRLRDILILIRRHLPGVQRVSSYCLPRNIRDKSEDQLRELRDLGLGLLYVGCESGDDAVLRRVNKGETAASSLAALLKMRAAGIKSSVMILNGLGGPDLLEQHARNSARLMNEAQPDYLSTLVVTFPLGRDRFESTSPGFRELSQRELFQEMELLLQELRLEKTIFRSDHASNYLALKGVLNKDRARLIDEVRDALADRAMLRPEWARGL